MSSDHYSGRENNEVRRQMRKFPMWRVITCNVARDQCTEAVNEIVFINLTPRSQHIETDVSRFGRMTAGSHVENPNLVDKTFHVIPYMNIC